MAVNAPDKSTGLQRGIDLELAQKLRRLNGQMGLPQTAKGKWSARQPSVFAASILLAFFILSLDIPYRQLALILSVALFISVCALITTRSVDTS